MKIRFYTDYGALCGELNKPSDLKLIPGDTSMFVLDADDVAAWEQEECLNKIRAEAQRRIMALVNARNVSHLDVLISNANREAIRLLRKSAANWTAEEAARAVQLEQIDIAIEAIRAASNVLEADPPEDCTDDQYWP